MMADYAAPAQPLCNPALTKDRHRCCYPSRQRSASQVLHFATGRHAVRVNKSAVLRAIQEGKASATRSEHGQWVIKPAELHRVYPPAVAGDCKRASAGNDAHRADLAEANQRAALAERPGRGKLMKVRS